VCERETERGKDGEKAKEREAGRQNEWDRGNYTQRERVCVCLSSDTNRKKDR